MSKVADLHKKWSEDPEDRKAYDGLGPEFEISRSLIEARTRPSSRNLNLPSE